MTHPKDEIQTARLRMRPFASGDLEALHALISSPQVARFLFADEPFTLAQTRQWLESMIASWRETGREHMAVLDKESGLLLGFAGLSLEEIEDGAFYEVGCVLGQAHWGQGYATEILLAVLESQGRGLGPIIGIIKPGHEASIALCQKLGFTFWKTSRYQGEEVLVYRQG